MKYLGVVHNLILWSWSCLKVWYRGIDYVTVTRPIYWDIRQVLFPNRESQEAYSIQIEFLVKRLNQGEEGEINLTTPAREEKV